MTHAHQPAHLRVERRLVQTCFSVFVQQYAIYLTWRPVSCTPISKPPEQADITSNHPAYISKSTPRSRLRRRIDTILNATATRQFCIRPINNPCYCQRCLPHGLISSPTSTRILSHAAYDPTAVYISARQGMAPIASMSWDSFEMPNGAVVSYNPVYGSGTRPCTWCKTPAGRSCDYCDRTYTCPITNATGRLLCSLHDCPTDVRLPGICAQYAMFASNPNNLCPIIRAISFTRSLSTNSSIISLLRNPDHGSVVTSHGTGTAHQTQNRLRNCARCAKATS